MGLTIGNRVVRKAWLEHPDWLGFARCGTIMTAPSSEPGYSLRVFVRWDAGYAPLGKAVPPKLEPVPLDELGWLWWRST